jgi:hypothetical protein
MGKGGWQSLGTRYIASVLFVLAAVLCRSAQPVNDNLAGAIRLVGDHLSSSGSNAGATRESGEPPLDKQGGASVWWSWKASSAGMVTLSTGGSDFDTIVGIFLVDGSGNLSKIAFADDVEFDVTSLARAYVNKSAEYLFLIDGFSGRTGQINLTLFLDTSITPLNNDNYADAAAIGDPVSVRALNYFATTEANELRPDPDATRSVWWNFVAGATLPVVVSTEGSDFDTVVAVYDSNKQLVVWDDDTIESNERVRFDAQAGKNYRIGVYGYDEEYGLISLQLHTEIPLRATRDGNQLVLRWPAVFTGYSLEATALVDPFSWTPVNAIVATVGNQNEVRLPLGPPRGYRLKHQ